MAGPYIDRLIIQGDVILVPNHLQPILTHAAAGKTNSEIAALTGRTEQTVKNYVSELLVLAGVGNRVELALVVHGVHPQDYRTIPRTRQALDAHGP